MFNLCLNRRSVINLLRLLLMAGAAVWIYSPSFRGDWIWDDDILVISNSSLHTVRGLWEIWFTTPSTDYWPLTWTLLWFEWHLWGNHLFGYHLVSLALHLCSACLVWRLLHRLGVVNAWLGGLLFVVHPLVIESVAWVSEIKNTLSLPFFLLAFHSWLDFEEGKPAAYRRSIFYYLAAMLAKTSTVMLPLVLLLYCWWKRGRVTRQEFLRVIPYFAIAVVLGLVTIYFQNDEHNHALITAIPFITRLSNAATAVFFYLGKFVLPIGLLPIYPQWSLRSPSLLQLLSLPALVILLYGFWTQRATWARHLLFGLGFFLLNLLPVLGLINMEYLKISWVADHLAYLPIIGLIGVAAAAWGSVLQHPTPSIRLPAIALVTVTMALLAVQSHRAAALFSNQEAFWNHVILHNPNSPLARNNLAYCFFREGRVPEAKAQYEQVLQIDPSWYEVRYNLGVILLNQGNYPEAEADFRLVLKIVPARADMHASLAQVLAKTGRPAEAIQEYQTAIRLRADNPASHGALGDLLMQANRFPEAVEQYQLAADLSPAQAEIESSLAGALVQSGRLSEAIDHYEKSLQLDPADADAHANLGTALVQLGQLPDAIAHYQAALQIKPRNLQVRLALGVALGKSGHIPEAAQQFQEVLKIDPQNAQAITYLKAIKSMTPAPPPPP